MKHAQTPELEPSKAQLTRDQAATLLAVELDRASDRKLELRWEPIRLALATLQGRKTTWAEVEETLA